MPCVVPGMEMRVIGDKQWVDLGKAERHAEGTGERAPLTPAKYGNHALYSLRGKRDWCGFHHGDLG